MELSLYLHNRVLKIRINTLILRWKENELSSQNSVEEEARGEKKGREERQRRRS